MSPIIQTEWRVCSQREPYSTTVAYWIERVGEQYTDANKQKVTFETFEAANMCAFRLNAKEGA